MKKYIDPKRNSYSLIESQSMYGSETACEEALYNLNGLTVMSAPDAIADPAA